MQRIIQAGLGEMGRQWAETVAASRRWEATAYVDPDRKNLMDAASRHGMPPDRCFQSVPEALAAIEADALLDVAPADTRARNALAAFDWELDVLCEKPLASRLADAKNLAEAAERMQRILLVAQDYRYQPAVETLRRQIAQQRIGAVGYVDIHFHRGPRWDNYREQMAYPLILDMTIHHVDMLRFLLDSDVRSVRVSSHAPGWSWFKGDAMVMAQWEMENGVVANYSASWVSRGWETPWNGQWRIEGEKGALLLEDDVPYFSNKPSSRRKLAPVKMRNHRQAALLAEFGRCVTQRAEPQTSARRNLNSLAATHAMVRAAKRGGRVNLRELLR
ncbi:MAG: Gfo/Idh/MocA family protein [Candidatus Hydrogenedentota bacterium]